MNWLLRGAVIGAAIGLAAVAIVGTGGLAAVAVVGGLAAGGAGIGEVLSTMSGVAKEVTGKIVGPCSGNVYTNGKRAARAHVDMTACTKHPPVPLPIATGSGNVYINGQPAARVGDTIVCSAVITDGSANVYIGGGSQQTDTITPEGLVPPELHAVLLVVGIGSAVVLAGPIVAVAGLALAAAGGALGGWAGGNVFGEGSDGQKWSMLGGSLIAGLVGSKGGSVLAGKFIPKPTTPVDGFVKGGLPGMKEAAGNQAAAAGAAAQDRLDKSLGENSSELYSLGKPATQLERTYDHALSPQLFVEDVAANYGINLKGAGQKISVLYDESLPAGQLGVTRAIEGGRVIRIGPDALVDQATTANTIAHELSHARDYLNGGIHKPHGSALSMGDRSVYGSGNALQDWIEGKR